MGKASEARALRALRKGAEAAFNLDRQGRHDDALARADELAAQHPGSPLALHLAGRLHHAAANRSSAPPDKAPPDSVQHLASALGFLAEARRLAPDCIDVAVALCRVLLECERHEEAEAEVRRALAVKSPADPAESNIAHGVRAGGPGMDLRVESCRRTARQCFHVVVDWVRTKHVPRAAREVLGERRAARALKAAKALAARYPYSARAHCLSAYAYVRFARGLGADVDKRPFLDRVRADMNQAANVFDSSVVLAVLRAKLFLLLGYFDSAEIECRRAIAIQNPTDPAHEDVPLGSVAGEKCRDRVSSVCEEAGGLLQKLVAMANDYWCAMADQEQDGFLSVRFRSLQEFYGRTYEDSHWAAPTISDALSFVNENNLWTFWICPLCCAAKKLPDADSLLQHMSGEHLHGNGALQLQLDSDTNTGVDESPDGDYFLDEIAITQDLDSDDYVFKFTKSDYNFERLFLLASCGYEAKSFADMLEAKCNEGTKILHEIKQKLPANGDELDEPSTEIEGLWHHFLTVSAMDYREVILPLARSFLWSKLMKRMSEDGARKSIGDGDIDLVFPNVADAPESNATAVED